MLAILLAAALAGPPEGEAETIWPRSVDLETLEREHFRPEWCLPDSERALRIFEQARSLAAVEVRCTPSAPEELADLRTLGDVVQLASRLGPERSLASLLKDLERHAPSLLQEVPQLPQLLDSSGLGRRGWKPSRDARDDGIWMGPSWDVKREGRGGPWAKVRGHSGVHEAMVLVFSDLTTIKAAENDYTRYPSFVGARFDYIYPVANSYVRGTGDEAFAALAIDFQNDLPWPFSNYRCELKILNRLDPDGNLLCDIWSGSKDFYWMAGRDILVPLYTGDGDFVAMLMARQFGFDLDGVPDGASNRKEALRQGLGNLKIEAEEAFQRKGGVVGTVSGSIPPFTVLGPAR